MWEHRGKEVKRRNEGGHDYKIEMTYIWTFKDKWDFTSSKKKKGRTL